MVKLVRQRKIDSPRLAACVKRISPFKYSFHSGSSKKSGGVVEMSHSKQNQHELDTIAQSNRLSWIESPYVIWGVVLLAFLLRAALLLVASGHISRTFLPDTQSYIDPAIKLIATGRYPADSALRTPVYPVFIAIIYWIGGQDPLLIIAVQVVLGTLTVLLGYHLGIKVLSKPVALMGAFLLAINMESITSVFYVLTETLFTILFLAGILSWINGYKNQNKYWVVVAAIFMGLSALCRPVAVYFPFLLTIGLLLDKKIPWIRRGSDSVLFLGIFILCLLPWLLRNISVVGSPTLSTISSNNLLFYEANSLEANSRHISETAVREENKVRVAQMLVEQGWADNEGNRARVENILASQIILADPVRFLYVHLKSDLNGLLPDVTGPTEILGVTVGGKGTLSVLNQYGILAAINNYFGGQTWLLGLMLPLIIFLFLVYIFFIVGTIDVLRRRQWFAFLILFMPVLYFLILPGAASLPRFRVPAMVYICLLAGGGLQTIWVYCIRAIERKRTGKYKVPD
jgi:4-amino-4-deoxy-L-arabinose transferase-like glycosyltransferase